MNITSFVIITFLLFGPPDCKHTIHKPQHFVRNVIQAKSNEFDDLIKLFKKPGQSISENLLIEFFHIDSSSLQMDKYSTKDVLYFTENLIGLVYSIECAAGGICEKNVLALFMNQEYKYSIEVGHEYADLGGSKQMTYEIDHNVILLYKKEVTNRETAYGDVLEEITSSVTEKIFLNFENGSFQKN